MEINWETIRAIDFRHEVKLKYILPLAEAQKIDDDIYKAKVKLASEETEIIVNTKQNKWYAEKHSIGGDFLSYIALRENIINFEYLKEKKWIRVDKFNEIMKAAKAIPYMLELSPSEQNALADLGLGTAKSQNKTVLSVFGEKKRPMGISLADLQKMSLPQAEWYVKNRFPKKGIVLMSADASSYKSFLTTAMCLSVISGQDFLGCKTSKASKIMYLDQDNTIEMGQNRVALSAKGLDLHEWPAEIELYSNKEIYFPNNFNVLESMIEEDKPNIVVIDSLSNFLDGVNENNAVDMQPIMNKFQKLVDKYNILLIIIHHTNKSADPSSRASIKSRGSSTIYNSSHVCINIARGDGKNVFTLLIGRNKIGGESQPITICAEKDDDEEATYVRFKVLDKKEATMEQYAPTANRIIAAFEKNLIKFENRSEKMFKSADIKKALPDVASTEISRVLSLMADIYDVDAESAAIKRVGKRGSGKYQYIKTTDVTKEKSPQRRLTEDE